MTARALDLNDVTLLVGVLFLFLFSSDFLATVDKQTLLRERDQLLISLDQAQTRILSLTTETHRLQARYNILNTLHSQLEGEQKKLEAQLKGERRR